jgi:hypothetical protein
MLALGANPLGNPRRRQRALALRSGQLFYQSNGDTNGVFYFMGRQYGSAAWANPGAKTNTDVGAMQVAANCTAFNSTHGWLSGVNYQSAVADRVANLFHTDNSISNPYVIVDLIAATLIPNGVNMMQRNDFNASIADLTVDGGNTPLGPWTRLLTAGAMTAGQGVWTFFTIPAQALAFRYIKCSTSSTYLHCGELELYGALTYPAQ